MVSVIQVVLCYQVVAPLRQLSLTVLPLIELVILAFKGYGLSTQLERHENDSLVFLVPAVSGSRTGMKLCWS